MSQALYTSMSGINAATTSISVVSNNVANINTTAFKSADARFENLFSKTYTTGNSPTKTAGGINPKQIGMGVEVGSIVRNFTEGTYVATGRTEDLMISGGGYFTVMNSNGEIFYTRDGSFTLDANGNMVTQSGMYVLGASQIYNTSASQTKINIPKTIKVTQGGNNALGSAVVNELNDASITAGSFNVTFNNQAGPQVAKLTITEKDLKGSVDALISELNDQLKGIKANNGKGGADMQGIVIGANSDGTLSFKAQPPYTKIIATKTTAFMPGTTTESSMYSFKPNPNPTGKTLYWRGDSTNPELYTLAADGKSFVETDYKVSGFKTENGVDGVERTLTELTQISTGTKTAITADGKNVTNPIEVNPTIKFEAGTSNFLEATKLASAIQDENGSYNSKVLDYTVDIEPIAALVEAVKLESYSVGTDGTIEAAYSNGDKLTVEANKEDNTFEWKYTTSNGVVIRGADKIHVNDSLADTSGFVLQLATVTNEAGLVSKNNNLWSIGPNTGDTVYAVGGSMGLGEIQTGGLEGSNVDLSRELSNMILAQRAIQANSRVFSTASSIMETLSYLGS